LGQTIAERDHPAQVTTEREASSAKKNGKKAKGLVKKDIKTFEGEKGG